MGNQIGGINTLAISGTGISRIILLGGDLAFGHVGVGPDHHEDAHDQQP